MDGVTGTLNSKEVQIIGIGSTARGTNLPGAGDYDFAIKISDYRLVKKINDELRNRISSEEGLTVINGKDIRGAKINVLVNGELLEVDMDGTYSPKSLAFEYSPDECVNDRLHSIEEQHPGASKYVRAQIVLAKAMLKDLGIYKRRTSPGGGQLGGFGGIGVENWILQNGGSLEQAMETLVDASRGPDGKVLGRDEFAEKYTIYEYGHNHMSAERTHEVDGQLETPSYVPLTHSNYTCGFTAAGIQNATKNFEEFLEGKTLGQKAKDFVKGGADKVGKAGSRLWQSLFQPREIVSNRPALLTNYPKMKNLCHKYSGEISNIKKKDEVNANHDLDI